MSLYKQPGSRNWWVAIYRPGQKAMRRSTGTDDRAKAEALEAVLRLAQARTTPADRLHRLVDELAGEAGAAAGLPLAGIWPEYERWAAASGKNIAKTTLRDRRSAVTRFAAWAAEQWPAAPTAERVDRACAAAFARYLAGKGLKGKTRANVIGDLGTVWAALQRTRDAPTANPWPLAVPEVRDGERGRPFDRDQEAAVLRAADAAGHGWGLACRIARHTGLRYGDVARLTWGRVDLAGGWIALEPSKTARHGVGVRVPLAAGLRAALEQARPQDAAADAPVLPEHAAGYPNGMKKVCAFAEVLREAGMEGSGHTFHSWRHTFRTRLAEAGVSDELAKRLGGWTEDATALRYDHDGRERELRAAVESASGAAAAPSSRRSRPKRRTS